MYVWICTIKSVVAKLLVCDALMHLVLGQHSQWVKPTEDRFNVWSARAYVDVVDFKGQLWMIGD